MITRLDATSELIVSSPSVGGQSMMTTSNCRSAQPPSASRRTISRPIAVNSSTSVEASSSVAGATHSPWALRLSDDLVECDPILGEDVGHRLADVGERDAEPDGEVRLRIHVDAQDAIAALGQCAAEVDGAGGLAHSALLVCDRDDLGQRITFRATGAGGSGSTVDDRRSPFRRASGYPQRGEMSMSLCKDIRVYSELSTVLLRGP